MYLSIAAIVIVAVLSTTLWQSHKIASLQKTVDEAKQSADQKRKAAAQKCNGRRKKVDLPKSFRHDTNGSDRPCDMTITRR